MSTQLRRHPEYGLLAVSGVIVVTVLVHQPAGRLVVLACIGVVCVRWSVQHLLLGFLTLTLALEDTSSRPFRELWVSPVQHLGDVWFQNISTAVPGVPLRVTPLVLVSTWLLVRVATSRLGPRMERQRSPLPPRDEVRGALALVATASWPGPHTGRFVTGLFSRRTTRRRPCSRSPRWLPLRPAARTPAGPTIDLTDRGVGRGVFEPASSCTCTSLVSATSLSRRCS